MISSIQRVGVVGLGKMGLPMASHLQKRGFIVSGYDLDPNRKRESERTGIRLAKSARELASSNDFVIIVVGFDAEVEEVLLGLDGVVAGAHSGLIVGVASTVAPRTMQRISRSLDGTGVSLLDMPITR